MPKNLFLGKTKKKLVTVFSALAVAAAGMAFGEVESKNIVGFNDEGTTISGYDFTGIPFAQIGFNTANIQNLKIATSNGWGGEVLEIWDGTPSPTAGYTLYDPSLDPNAEATDYYWGDEAGTPVSVSIQPGQGIVLSGFEADLGKSTEGEVLTESASFTTISGYGFMSNPFSAALPVQNIKIATSNGWGGEVLEIWDGTPLPTSGYTLYDPSLDPNAEATDYYWGDETGVPVDAAIQPGQGFVLSGLDAGLEGQLVVPYSL